MDPAKDLVLNTSALDGTLSVVHHVYLRVAKLLPVAYLHQKEHPQSMYVSKKLACTGPSGYRHARILIVLWCKYPGFKGDVLFVIALSYLWTTVAEMDSNIVLKLKHPRLSKFVSHVFKLYTSMWISPCCVHNAEVHRYRRPY